MPRNYDNGKKKKKEKKRRRKLLLQQKLGLMPKKKACYFDKECMSFIDYKDVELLKRYITERGSIVAGRSTGNTKRWQRRLTLAVKRARFMALIPYCPEKYI
jgi:small subunit ribosomal protein S18